MAVSPMLRLPLVRAFDNLHSQLNSPQLYAVPWQTPTGLTYDADVDAWVNGAGAVVDPDLYTVSYYTIPALWGADSEGLALVIAGVSVSGDLAAIARAEYAPQLAGVMYVACGSLSGERYTVRNLENAPDGGAAVFVVAQLARRER